MSDYATHYCTACDNLVEHCSKNMSGAYGAELDRIGNIITQWAKAAGWELRSENASDLSAPYWSDMLEQMRSQHCDERSYADLAASGGLPERMELDPAHWNRELAPAQLVIDRCGEMTESGRKAIAKWLRDQASLVENSGYNFDDTFRARYLKR